MRKNPYEYQGKRILPLVQVLPPHGYAEECALNKIFCNNLLYLPTISPIDTVDLFLIPLSKQLNLLWIPVNHIPSSLPTLSRTQN